MSVASSQSRLVEGRCQGPRAAVRSIRHVTVQNLEGRKFSFEPFEITRIPPARQPRERMIDAEEKTLLTKVGKKPGQVVPPPLQLNMVPLAEVIDAHVEARSAWQDAAHFLAQEEVRQPAQGFGGVNRVMIRHRDQVHAESLQVGVEGERIVITLAANAAEAGKIAHSRVHRVDMQVTAHAPF